MTGDVMASGSDQFFGNDQSGDVRPRPGSIIEFMLVAAMVVAGCVAVVSSTSMAESMDPVAEFANDQAAPGQMPQQASELARSSATRVRVDELTSETTEVWALPEGGFEAVLSAGPVRVRRDGEWVPVDLTLVKAPSDGSVRTVADPNEVRLSGAKPTGSHELVSLGNGENRVSLGWTGALPEPVLDGSRATYREAIPGVDLEVDVTRGGVETFLVVKSPAAAERVGDVSFAIGGPNTSALSRDTVGNTQILDSSGRLLARSPAPEMWDAARDPRTHEPTRKAVVETPQLRSLTRAADTDPLELRLTPDLEWMRDPATKWPVTIDPQINPASTTFDTYVMEGDLTENGGANDYELGLLSGDITRTLARWDTTALVGKQITSATVSFWSWWSNTCTAKSWELWTTGPVADGILWENQPTWNNREATSTTTKGFDSSCADAWVSISGTSFFQRAATAGDTRADMGLRATDETDGDAFKQFRSRNADDSAQVPYAVVNYNSYPTVGSRSTVPASNCVTGTSRPTMNTVTPQFTSVISDPDGGTVKAEFEWWAVGGTTKIGSAVTALAATGSTFSTTVPAGAFAEAGSYQWRVRGNDGSLDGAWSSFCEFKVMIMAPPVPGCSSSSVDGDVNGDGTKDVVIGDPKATVNGQAAAGALHVVDGVSGTTATVTQDGAEIPGTSEPADQFGHTLSVYDANRDGCADVAVGSPYEDNGTVADAGEVQILFGSPAGLGKSPTATAIVWTQGVNGVPGTQVKEDLFGFSLASGRTAAGEPFLVVGAPGDDVSGKLDAGTVTYLRGGTKITFDQSSVGNIGGGAEQDDRGGWALAATPYHFAVAYPGQRSSAGAAGVFSGRVCVFTHILTSSLPGVVGCVDQDSSGVSDAMESGDTFGKSVAMASYWPTGDSLLAVGAPGEDAVGGSDVGLVHQFRVSGTTIAQLAAIDQNTAMIADTNEPGDLFGEKITLVNTNPAVAPTAQTLLIAVGVPGEDYGSAVDAGNLHVFAAGTTNPTFDTLVERAAGKLPGSPAKRELLGFGGGGSASALYVSSPYANRAVWTLPWPALAAGSAAPTRTLQPGLNGAPADAVAFGEQVG
ncbi:DNRLRE domain-containing protein [Micromonospora sp. NBC_00860]|uniref:DNRLRE domain-containing protein n=1 Tax=Micromonospora sp. NBC_00860 TaxID=2975980 RepID=UPI003867BE5B|nr:DNRLRE domain-containing protein [Micromonospora sp. NBC_00860]